MNGKFRGVMLAISLALASVFASPAMAAPQQNDHVVTVTDRNNNSTVGLAVGDTLVVRLASNASTGYTWRIGQNNDSLLAPQGEPAYENSSSAMPGAQGTQVFTFTAVAAGGDALTFLYQRSNAGTQDTHTFRLRAVISEASPTKGKTLNLADADSNSAIKAAVGDTLIVRLTASLSAGFTWRVIDNAPAVLKAAGDAQVRGATRPSASVTQVFTFTVVSTGEASLKLAYQRAGTGQTTRTWQSFVDVPAAAASAAATRSILANFACDAGVTFQATFGNDVAAVTFDNQTKTLRQQPAADGARYADANWELRSAGGKTTLTDLKTNELLAVNCIDQNAVTQ